MHDKTKGIFHSCLIYIKSYFTLEFISDCSPPSSPSSGSVVANKTNAIYSCEEGFVLKGPQQRSCQDNGLGWTGITPSCSKLNHIVCCLCNIISIIGLKIPKRIIKNILLKQISLSGCEAFADRCSYTGYVECRFVIVHDN